MLDCTVDISGLLKKLARVPRERTRILDAVVRQDARGFVRDIVGITPPSMGRANVASKKRGEAAVMGDIRKVYATAAGLYPLIRAEGGMKKARQFWWLVTHEPGKVEPWIAGCGIASVQGLRPGWDAGDEHERRRNRRGRVAGNAPSARLRPEETRALVRYIKEMMTHVGMLAGGFAPAARKLGVGLPVWVMRHAGLGLGTIDVEEGGGRFLVRISNKARHAPNDLARRMAWVLRSGKRGKRIRNKLHAEIRAVLRGAGLVVR